MRRLKAQLSLVAVPTTILCIGVKIGSAFELFWAFQRIKAVLLATILPNKALDGIKSIGNSYQTPTISLSLYELPEELKSVAENEEESFIL